MAQLIGMVDAFFVASSPGIDRRWTVRSDTRRTCPSVSQPAIVPIACRARLVP